MSLPDLLVRVKRYETITIQYQTFIDQKLDHMKFNVDRRDMSELIQHEIDHLDGSTINGFNITNAFPLFNPSQ
jgi:peptide deformylase